jgi:Na+/melibiose symporter-like transporter
VLGYSALGAALRILPMAPIMLTVAPLTPRLAARFGTHRIVAVGMGFVGIGFALFRELSLHTPYSYVLLCLLFLISGIALAMSPMTAQIMSAVPPRRAGAGSAMNDATRELGAALGIAVLGSLAASRYSSALGHALSGLSIPLRTAARGSLAGALRAAATLPPAARHALEVSSKSAFVDGIHLAVTAGAVLAFAAAFIVFRFLPHSVAHQAGPSDALGALEDTAELGLGGVPPVFAED